MIDFENAALVKLHSTDNDAYAKLLTPMLIPGEEIVQSYRTVRDGVVFTDKRIFVINIQGVTGKEKDITSLPYKKIQAFSLETAGVIDIDSELQLWFSGLGIVRLEFSAGSDIGLICRLISQGVL